MKFLTSFCVVVCVASVLTFAAATPVKSGENSVLFNNDIPLTKEGQSARDWLTDMIDAILNWTVGELLSAVDSSLERLTGSINEGAEKIRQILNAVDPDVRDDIDAVMTNFLTEAGEIVTPLLEKLGLVLPQITEVEDKMHKDKEGGIFAWGPNDAADLIKIILGMTLEEFLGEIVSVLEKSDELIMKTIVELADISQRISDPALVEEIKDASDTSLNSGRAVIRPILDSLYKLPITKHLKAHRGIK